MFDDDKSYLEKLAQTLRGYFLPVKYVDDYTIITVYKESQGHFVGLVRKKRNMPFYQAFVVEFEPSNLDYMSLGEGNKLIEYVFANKDETRAFFTSDVSGHENFQGEFLRALKEKLK